MGRILIILRGTFLCSEQENIVFSPKYPYGSLLSEYFFYKKICMFKCLSLSFLQFGQPGG